MGILSAIAINWALNMSNIQWTRWAMALMGMIGIVYLAFLTEEGGA